MPKWTIQIWNSFLASQTKKPPPGKFTSRGTQCEVVKLPPLTKLPPFGGDLKQTKWEKDPVGEEDVESPGQTKFQNYVITCHLFYFLMFCRLRRYRNMIGIHQISLSVSYTWSHYAVIVLSVKNMKMNNNTGLLGHNSI